MKNHTIFMTLLLCLPHFSNSTENQEPYPVSPIGMEGVINRTIPNVAIIVDNSDTMETAIKKNIAM